MCATRFISFAALAVSACSRPAAPPATLPPEVPAAPQPLDVRCTADDMGLVFPLAVGEEPPPGFSELEITFDRDIACFDLVAPPIEGTTPDAGYPGSIEVGWATWAVRHPPIGSKLTLAIKNGGWEYEAWPVNDSKGRNFISGSLPRRAIVRLTPGAEEGLLRPFRETAATPDVLAAHWEKVRRDPRRLVHIERTVPVFDTPFKVLEGPAVMVDARWDRAAGALNFDPFPSASEDHKAFVSDHALSPATPQLLPEGFALWALPLQTHPKKNFKFVVDGYRL